MRKTLMVLLISMLAAWSTAFADGGNLDPATLHIGPGAGTSCAEGCAGEPNLIGSGADADIFQNDAGAKNLAQPVLFIIGVPNDTTNLFAGDPVAGVTFINAYPGGTTTSGTSAFASAGTYGLISPVMDGFFGDLGSGSEIYSFLGLDGPTDHSNSFTNWSAADLAANGITASDFGIYVFAINGALGPKGLVDIMTPGGLPLGTFAVAYGQVLGKHGNTVYDTPFTEAGLTDGRSSTPEPASLLLLGSGLLGLGGMLRKRLGV